MREKIDLHIHSCYSDGTMRVSEIIEEAKKQHVKYLAISDHDVIEGSKELLATSHDLHVVSGVELNAFDLNQNIHVLGYGVDLENENFAAFCKENRARLEYVNERLIQIWQVKIAVRLKNIKNILMNQQKVDGKLFIF